MSNELKQLPIKGKKSISLIKPSDENYKERPKKQALKFKP